MFLDADTLCLANIDELFSMPALSAVVDCLTTQWCPETQRHMPAQWDEAAHAAACPLRFGVPLPRESDAAYFNAGVMVLHPSRADFGALLSVVQDGTPWPGDQDPLNTFFRRKWNVLPPSYNWFATLHDTHPDVAQVKRPTHAQC